ncbi:MAG: hypothetical protein KKF65_06595 [Nanoarchaeota archaeon]|nr:hypothetical protein [Nanoarchaeota archaeon]
MILIICNFVTFLLIVVIIVIMDFSKGWDHDNSPLLWVEMIYFGDTESMKKYFGMSYGLHYFLSREQKTTFYKNKVTEAKAKKFGKKKYSDHDFVKYFCKESENVEQSLIEVVDGITNSDLSSMNNEELASLFEKFFKWYSALIGFYRFSRPDFYDELIKEVSEQLGTGSDKDMAQLLSEDSDLNLSGDLKKLVKGLKMIGDRRFKMHKAWQENYNQAKVLFKEIGKRIDLNSLEVQNCVKKEIVEALRNRKKIDKQEVCDRIKGFKFVYHKDYYEVMIMDELSNDEIVGVNEIIGKTAYPGKVRGRVTLLHESLSGVMVEDMNKMPEGNVLVAVMTSPDMMMAVHKASAIVTDVGGILCHAAIVAREYKIPCIIGTKIATKVLKDGDLVEVDAEKGEVRIIG